MSDIPETTASQRYADTKSMWDHLNNEREIRLELGNVRAKLSDLRAAIPIWESHEEELSRRLEGAIEDVG